MSSPSETGSSQRPQDDDIRRPPPEGDEQSGKATFAHERPQDDEVRRPPPKGDEQSGRATFAHELTDAQYHRLTGAVLASIETTADRWLQDDLIDVDTHRTGGLLELKFPNGTQLIINTQPPLHELWLAARGGGFHYRFERGGWVDTRDGSEFFESLSRHASAQGGMTLRFEAPGTP